MKEPTEEQIKELWEWCGLKWFWAHNPDCHCGAVDDEDSERNWEYKVDGKWKRASNFWHEKMNDTTRPEFLGYLFKYAVPKFEQCCIESMGGGHYGARVSLGDTLGQGEGKDPALALFWAIHKVINESNS